MSSDSRPNILFLFPEDMRADCISAYGNPHIRTPHLDGLVSRGFNFRRNYCAGANSGAVCIPSRAMLMSGKHWMHSNNELRGETIFPELLRNNGFTTFLAGKWHNGRESALRGFERGKSVFLGGMSDHTRVPVEDIVDGESVNPRFGEKFSTDLFADAAVEFLETYDEERPFLAYCAFTAPHDPRQPKAEYVQEYYETKPPLPANFAPVHAFDNGDIRIRDEELGPLPRTAALVREQLAEYYGLVTHLDEQVGRILATLAASEHAGNTIIIFGVDHGLAVGSHGLLGKQNVYEHSMRVPLIVAGPGIPSGSTEALTYLLDVYPTICSLTGLDAPDDLFGRDLQPLWEGRSEGVREAVFLPYLDRQRAVTDGRWKLHRYPQIDHQLLFDLDDDPFEMDDLAADPAHADTVERMLELLRQCQRDFGDILPLRVDNPAPKELVIGEEVRVPDRSQPDWIREKYFDGVETSPQGKRAIAAEEARYGASPEG